MSKATLAQVIVVALFTFATSAYAGAEESTFAQSALSQQIIGVAPWKVSGTTLICVFAKPHHRSGDSDDDTNLTIYKKLHAKLGKVFEKRSGDSFLYVHPISENGRLMVVWTTGSAYHFEVFAYVDKVVREVLDTGSRSIPELLFDDEGREYLLFNDMEMAGGEWRSSAGKTRIFKWEGTEYKKLGDVPWAKRFDCVAKQSCSPSN